MAHIGNIEEKIKEASSTLFKAEKYLNYLADEIEELKSLYLLDEEVEDYISHLLPIGKDASDIRKHNVLKLRESLRNCYYHAPDLQGLPNNGYRFINAVSDFATHTAPLRRTSSYRENVFAKTVDGNPLIDKAYRLLKLA